MILDNAEQKKNLLAMVAATQLAGGTMSQLKPQIAVLEDLEAAIKAAEIKEAEDA